MTFGAHGAQAPHKAMHTNPHPEGPNMVFLVVWAFRSSAGFINTQTMDFKGLQIWIFRDHVQHKLHTDLLGWSQI